VRQSGQALYASSPEEVDTLIGSIEQSVLTRGARALSSPLNPILPDGEEQETYQDVSRT
jgi:hypothetical protein